METTHYIVGIGSSAGGVQALSALFSFLPPNTGMAFIVVQHVGRESRLHEILAGVTKMPVSQVKVKTQVAPDNVYVIAPSTDLSFKGHTLCPSARDGKLRPNRSVDFFFRS